MISDEECAFNLSTEWRRRHFPCVFAVGDLIVHPHNGLPPSEVVETMGSFMRVRTDGKVSLFIDTRGWELYSNP